MHLGMQLSKITELSTDLDSGDRARNLADASCRLIAERPFCAACVAMPAKITQKPCSCCKRMLAVALFSDTQRRNTCDETRRCKQCIETGGAGGLTTVPIPQFELQVKNPVMKSFLAPTTESATLSSPAQLGVVVGCFLWL